MPIARASGPDADRPAVAVSTWRGRRGSVILGPTEDRVARYLEASTRHGRVTIRTLELARHLGLERSEAYRITRRLRVLGLFGIENDQGGTQGGRRYWRTATTHEGAELDAGRHRTAWARVVAYLRARRVRLGARLAHLRQRSPDRMRPSDPRPTSAASFGFPLRDVAGGTFGSGVT